MENPYEERVDRIMKMMLECENTSYEYLVSMTIKKLGGKLEKTIKDLSNLCKDKMVHGGKFNVDHSYDIRNAEMMNRLLYLIPLMKRKDQQEILDEFIMICKESMLNCSLLCEKGIITILISIVQKFQKFELSFNNISKLVHILGVLGGFRIKPNELKALINLMVDNETGSLEYKYAPLLTQELIKMTRKKSPSSFFNFDGKDGGLILSPGEFKFPKGGFSFSTWFRIEKNRSKQTRLFSFLDSRGSGVECYFERSQVVIYSVRNKITRKFEFSQFLATGRWCHFCLVYHKENKFFSLFNSSKMKLYLNGVLKEITDFDIPSFKAVTFGHICSSVTSPSGMNCSGFCGQMGPIALFDIALPQEIVEAVYKKGPDFQYDFKKLEINNNLILLYNPRVCGVKKCLDNSISKQNTCKVLAGTRVLVSNSIRLCIYLIGGVETIFPLIEALKEKWVMEYSICARILTLIGYLLENKITRSEILKKKSLLTLSLILEKLSVDHLNKNTLQAMKGLLMPLKRNDEVRKDILINLFFNFRLWIRTPYEVQRSLLKYLVGEIEKEPHYYRKIIGVQFLLDSLRIFYWYNEIQNVSYFCKTRPEKKDLKKLRGKILQMIRIFLKNGVTDSECHIILANLVFSNDLEVREELLLLLYKLTSDSVTNFVSVVSRSDWYIPFLSMLENPDLGLRIKLLKVFGKIIEKKMGNFLSLTDKQTNKMYISISKILKNYPLDNCMYYTLIELLYCTPTLKIAKTMEYDILQNIRNINILEVILKLLSENVHKMEDFKMKEVAIHDINVMLKSNKKNRLAMEKIPNWITLFLNTLTPYLSQEIINESKGKKKTKEEFYGIIVPLVLDCIILIHSENFEKKNFYKDVFIVLSNIDLLKDHGSVNVRLLHMEYFKNLVPKICEQVKKFIEKDKYLSVERPFWKNLFLVLSYFLNFILFPENDIFVSTDDKLDVVRKILKCFDSMISKSFKNEKVMKLLHFVKFPKQSSVFSLRNAVKQFKNYFKTELMMDFSLFKILFLLNLYIFKNEKNNETFKKMGFIERMLCVICNDVREEETPNKTESMRVTTLESRQLYILCTLFLELQNVEKNYEGEEDTEELKKYCQRYIIIIKAVLRNLVGLLRNWLTDERSKELLEDENLNYLHEKSKLGIFLHRWRTEWKPTILANNPLKEILVLAGNENRIFNDRYCEKMEKKKNKLRQKQLSVIEKDDNKKINSFKEKIIFKEIQRLDDKLLSLKYRYQRTCQTWKKNLNSMYSENGIYFSSSKKKDLKKYYIIDETENFLRMRKRLILNDEDGSNYSNNTYNKKGELELKKLMERKNLKDSILKSEEEIEKENKGEEDVNSGKNTPNSIKENLGDDWENISTSSIEVEKKNRSQFEQEKKQLIKKCFRILPFEKIEGLLEITNKSIYFLVEGEKNISNEENEKNENKKGTKEIYILLNNITQILKRRFLFQWTALEIFMKNKKTIMFNFDNIQDLETVQKAIIKQKPENLDNSYFGLNPKQILKKSNITQKWVSGKLSNFEYLMLLNTYASRSYNDISQYFIFPWVITNFHSKELNLKDLSNYRDLSKPVGALNDKNVKLIMERYNSFSDGRIPKFHYGSHYSSVSVPTYFLIRVEPFTRYNLKLQGNYFDIPDRLFNSILESWNNTQTQMSDVKELIPEFFYFPDFLKNDLELDLGKRQDKRVVNHVELPLWCGNSASKFISIHRQALESKYVTENLHLWIDLIFGYKQRGKEAEKAMNKFYYLTYEHLVKPLSEIKDPILRKSAEIQMSSFGQTPPQLFTKPHPKKEYSPKRFKTPQYWNVNWIKPFYELQASGKSYAPIIYVNYTERDVLIVVDKNRKFRRFDNFRKPSFVEMVNPVGNYFANSIKISCKLFENTSTGLLLISSGHFDKSIKLIDLYTRMEIKQSVSHHDLVNCIKLSEMENYLVSGSSDCQIKIWKLIDVDSKNRNYRKIELKSQANGDDQKFNNDQFRLKYHNTLYGHESEILCVDINENLDTIISGDSSGRVKVFSLVEGKYVRTIVNSNNMKINFCALNKLNGDIFFYSREDSIINRYSINGKLIERIKSNELLNDFKFSKNGKYLFTAGNTLVVYKYDDLNKKIKFNTMKTRIISITQKGDNEIIVGCRNGKVSYYGFDFGMDFKRESKRHEKKVIDKI